VCGVSRLRDFLGHLAAKGSSLHVLKAPSCTNISFLQNSPGTTPVVSLWDVFPQPLFRGLILVCFFVTFFLTHRCILLRRFFPSFSALNGSLSMAGIGGQYSHFRYLLRRSPPHVPLLFRLSGSPGRNRFFLPDPQPSIFPPTSTTREVLPLFLGFSNFSLIGERFVRLF